jgi:hypothetical protein
MSEAEQGRHGGKPLPPPRPTLTLQKPVPRPRLTAHCPPQTSLPESDGSDVVKFRNNLQKRFSSGRYSAMQASEESSSQTPVGIASRFSSSPAISSEEVPFKSIVTIRTPEETEKRLSLAVDASTSEEESPCNATEEIHADLDGICANTQSCV